MKAKEMFEKLGYNFKKGWLYKRHVDALNYYKEIPDDEYNEEYILFDVVEQTFWKEDSYGTALEITQEELQAVIQQCKEMGWVK